MDQFLHERSTSRCYTFLTDCFLLNTHTVSAMHFFRSDKKWRIKVCVYLKMRFSRGVQKPCAPLSPSRPWPNPPWPTATPSWAAWSSSSCSISSSAGPRRRPPRTGRHASSPSPSCPGRARRVLLFNFLLLCFYFYCKPNVWPSHSQPIKYIIYFTFFAQLPTFLRRLPVLLWQKFLRSNQIFTTHDQPIECTIHYIVCIFYPTTAFCFLHRSGTGHWQEGVGHRCRRFHWVPRAQAGTGGRGPVCPVRYIRCDFFSAWSAEISNLGAHFELSNSSDSIIMFSRFALNFNHNNWFQFWHLFFNPDDLCRHVSRCTMIIVDEIMLQTVFITIQLTNFHKKKWGGDYIASETRQGLK